jgi:isochorismate hydrolase
MMMQKFKFFEGVIKDTYIVDVQQGIRTLRATWRHEDMEDINTIHGIDAEAELTRMLSDVWANEVDREVLRTLNRNWNGGQRA